MALKSESKSIIGENSFFQGKFYIEGELHINGKFEGVSLRVDNLYVGRNGRVKSNITTINAVIEGIVVGNITAKNRIMLLPTARILGNIKTPELIIQRGVILEGKCTITHDLENPARDLILKLYEGK